MRAVTVIPPGGGELVGDAPDRRVEILSDDDALHATWRASVPGATAPTSTSTAATPICFTSSTAS